MNLYLIRHGQTIDHKNKYKQNPDSGLSPEGKNEARKVASLLKNEAVDFVLSSKMVRAQETAIIIAEDISKPLTFMDGIEEKRYCKELEKVSYESQIYLEYKEEVRKNWNDIDWRFRLADETLREVCVRASTFKNLLLTEHRTRGIVVVSHGIFLKCFLAVCLLERFDNKDFMSLFNAISFRHGGMSILNFDDDLKQWRLIF